MAKNHWIIIITCAAWPNCSARWTRLLSGVLNVNVNHSQMFPCKQVFGSMEKPIMAYHVFTKFGYNNLKVPHHWYLVIVPILPVQDDMDLNPQEVMLPVCFRKQLSLYIYTIDPLEFCMIHGNLSMFSSKSAIQTRSKHIAVTVDIHLSGWCGWQSQFGKTNNWVLIEGNSNKFIHRWNDCLGPNDVTMRHCRQQMVK